MRTGSRVVLGALCALGVVANVAVADLPTEPIMSIEVCQPGGTCLGGYSLDYDDANGHWWQDGNDFYFQLDQDIEIFDDATGLTKVATLKADDGQGNPTVISLFEDPSVNLNFAVQAGATDAIVTMTSSTLPVSLTNPSASAQIAWNLSDGDFSDIDGDGNYASLRGQYGSGGAYRARYNAGSVFTDLVTSEQHAGFGDSIGFTDSYVSSIAGGVTQISSQIYFELTANDLASGTSEFEVIPEPASLLLLVASLGLLRRRG